MSGAYKLQCATNSGIEVLAIANELAQNPAVEWAEPDMLMKSRGGRGIGSKNIEQLYSETSSMDFAPAFAQALRGQSTQSTPLSSAQGPNGIPDDPLFSYQWALHSDGSFGSIPYLDIDADQAWDITTGDAAIKVVVLDVGIEQSHPEINQLPGADFTGSGGGGGPVNACDNQGTNVAGCITGFLNNSVGIAGVAPDCKVVSAKIAVALLSCDDSWSGVASYTVDAIHFGDTSGCRVSVNSNQYGFTSGAIDAEYATSYANGMIHFGMSGYTSIDGNLNYPGSIAQVNAINSVRLNGTRSGEYGPGLFLTCPGELILTTDRSGADGYDTGDYNYFYVSGPPSYAAAVAALILSQEPALTPSQVEDRMG
ncbi:MAG TPA: S8 family serine peptidase, partial [candidate division Zixibacteria bacterium]|nr:S8 family serine peptidase [candidate division Zixibacteria bacterium]